ncbi:MAG TPA: hypothetical protein VG323_12330 [Thermoanaerobaculia bacterium]|nr:hypothetical protein [Thermoanaerobaculia bacterium]
MTTTAIVAEILVGGLQTLFWLAALFFAIHGLPSDSGKLLHETKDFVTPLTFALVAFSYVLGVLVDRIADSLFHPIDKWVRRRELPKCFSVPRTRLLVMHKGEQMTKFLDYVRSRMRLARSTAFNCIAGTIAAVLLVERQHIDVSVCAVAVTGFVAVAAAAFAWIRISRTYYRRLAQALDVLNAEPQRQEKGN